MNNAMPVRDDFLLSVLAACAAAAPLYPKTFALEANIERGRLDEALDELRKRGLVALTEWVPDRGQGYALTEAGRQSLNSGNVLWALPTELHTQAAPDHAQTAYERGEQVRAVFMDRPPAVVSRILLALNLLYFGYGAFFAWQHDLSVADYLAGESPPPLHTTNIVLIELGAIHPALVFPANPPHARPEFERIVLFNFLHIGLLHLFMNMYFLATLGPLIEAMWGRLRFLAIYASAGIVSGCMILLIDLLNGQGQLTAGASGALFGIFAALVVWFGFNHQYLPERFVENWKRTLLINSGLLLCINFLPGISWSGHLGGAVGGGLTALLLHVQRYHPSAVARLAALAGVPLVPLGFFAAMLWQAHAP